MVIVNGLQVLGELVSRSCCTQRKGGNNSIRMHGCLGIWSERTTGLIEMRAQKCFAVAQNIKGKLEAFISGLDILIPESIYDSTRMKYTLPLVSSSSYDIVR
jgi:hypothetical protein